MLWGHAYRFGFSPVVTKTGIDAMDFEELSAVLGRLNERFRLVTRPTSPRSWTSLDSTHAISRRPKWLFNCRSTATTCWPPSGYSTARLARRHEFSQGSPSPKDRLMGAAELGSYIVRRFCESYQAPKSLDPTDSTERAVSLTLLDLDRARDLFSLTESLARELAIAMDDDEEELSLALSLFRRSQTAEDKPFV